ncbi:pectate lyase [Streptomyces cyaneogriseus subsp. noncyanogenus]|uniref:Pectate lyase n=1 Tax=Streptomyces cyaneogriseus subsp. noncyanogenus TaxID=477245 RepID=A0A0C5FUR1_9ACTN|nr:pectinesterase family protein [Streptomyces cyaneogriseus]AJP01438.1 pectate lyase [Streptomyces cyaneogriseus subsp. noncyanogenus]
MTHPTSKRPPAAGRTLAASLGLAGALALATAGQAQAAPAAAAGTGAARSAAAAGAGEGAAGGRWTDVPHGFASLAGGTTGGAGGKVVTVTDQAGLAKYAAAEEPYIIRVRGSIAVEPFGADIAVASDKTIVGMGDTGEIVHGELHLAPGTHNVIIRNLTIRDSAVEGDWDCKDTDFDGIQMDTAHHVWVDHNRFSNICDGQLDIRKDSEYVTVSYNRFENNNKTFGIGWTSNVRTQITVDHNWFADTKQRNPSVDNAAYAHLYNNYLTAQADPDDPVWTYGNWSRGKTRMVIENSYYRDVQHPYQADATAELVERGSILQNTTGRHDEWGEAFDPHAFYAYRPDPAAAVPALVQRFSGPQKRVGDAVTLHVPADYPTVQAAVDAVPAGNDGRVVVAVAPGTYREKVFVPAAKPNISLQGTGQKRSETVIVHDTPAAYGGSSGSATVRIAASDVTARNLTFANDFDEAAHELNGEQALAVKTTGDRIVFEDTAFLGNQDTLMTDSPAPATVSRVYIRDSYIEGDVDFLYGRATTVVERGVIKALSRGSATNNGYITAPSTWKGNPYGFLITRSRIVSDAPAGTFHLGRPWHPGGDPDAVGQVLIRDTWLPAAVKSAPWTDMSGFSWKDARFAEYRNSGPGAAVTADRPQLGAEEARAYTVAAYLRGTDGWAPHTRH